MHSLRIYDQAVDGVDHSQQVHRFGPPSLPSATACGPGRPTSACRRLNMSTWLKGGVEVTRVADWAGHSVAVVMRLYAKFIDRSEQTARAGVEDARSILAAKLIHSLLTGRNSPEPATTSTVLLATLTSGPLIKAAADFGLRGPTRGTTR